MTDVHEEILEALNAAWGNEPGTEAPPLHQFLQLQWHSYEHKRYLNAEVILPAAHTGPFASIETGIAAAAVETVAVALACIAANKRCITLTCEYTAMKQAIADGLPVSIEAQTRATRKSIVFVEGVLKDRDRKTMLHLSATFAALKTKRPHDDE